MGGKDVKYLRVNIDQLVEIIRPLSITAVFGHRQTFSSDFAQNLLINRIILTYNTGFWAENLIFADFYPQNLPNLG